MMDFMMGEQYTRRQIHKALGGDTETYLPQVGHRIVCGCFNKEMGPNAPEEILAGNKPRVVQKAEVLIKQAEPVPVFLKRKSNKWEYMGEYRVTGHSRDPRDLRMAERTSGRSDLAMVLRMERAHRIANQYLQYWRTSTADRELGSLLNHHASDFPTYRRVREGDTVWMVTTRNGGLVLLGRVIVGHVIEGQRQAEKHLGTRDIWKAKYHVVARPGTECFVREVDTSTLIPKLEFNSVAARRLPHNGGRLNGRPLQTVRTLTPDSAELLRAAWERSSRAGDPGPHVAAQARGAAFGDPDTNPAVELAAVSFVTRWYLKRGWNVNSVESQKCGFDLLCSKDSREEHVEVKGTRGTLESFIITAREYQCAETDDHFALCLVTSALSSERKLHRHTAKDMLRAFDFIPLQLLGRKKVRTSSKA